MEQQDTREIQQTFSKKELRQQRREERREAIEQTQTRKKITRIIWWGISIGIVFALIGGIAWTIVAHKPPPLGEDFSREIAHEGATHVTENESVAYQSNPPTSGNHWPDPLRDGIYEEEKPDEAIVHSMEHGRIWISYRPDISEEAEERLRAIAKREARVILTPRAANDTDIALAAWNRLDAFDVSADGFFDENRVKDFIRRYRDKGPEYVPQMTGKTY